jgi:LAS superfamily LD-carboxypeptidase LdcB
MGIFKIRKIAVMIKLMYFAAFFILLCAYPGKTHKNDSAHQNDSYTVLHKQDVKEDTGVLHKKEDEDTTSSTKQDIEESAGVLHSEKYPEKYDISTPEKDYLIGKTDFSKDSGFVKLNPAHCNDRTIYLRIEVAEAFEKMRIAALRDSVVLFVLSGARSFEQQKNIWEEKWNSLRDQNPKARAFKILKYSSMPMSSRHHWGTDIDLCNLKNNYFEKGKGLKIYSWLTANAHKYGFCQVYTDKQTAGRTGYEMEKWHWSYMPISVQLLERYNKIVKIDDFKGFLGWEMAPEVQIIEKYVNGIYDCKGDYKKLRE